MPAAEADHVVPLDIEVEAAVAIIVGPVLELAGIRIVEIVCGGPAACIGGVDDVVVVVAVVNLHPVAGIVLPADGLLGNVDVVGLGIPDEGQVIVAGAPETLTGSAAVGEVALFIEGFAVTDAVHFVILDVCGVDLAPPALVEGDLDGIASLVGEVLVSDPHEGDVAADRLFAVPGGVVLVFDFEARGVHSAFLGVGIDQVESGLGLAVGELDVTCAEHAGIGEGCGVGNRDGAAGVLAGNGDGDGGGIQGVLDDDVAVGNLLSGEVYPVATFQILRAGLEGFLNLLAGSESHEADGCKKI